MQLGTRELPDMLRHLSVGAVEAAHQVTDLVEDSAAAVARTARTVGPKKHRRRGDVRSLALWAVLFIVAVAASRWWARRPVGGDVPPSPPPDVAARVEHATPASEVDKHMA